MLTRSYCAGALAAVLAGCGSGSNDAMQNYGGIDGSATPATTAPAPPAPGAGTSGGTPQAPAPANGGVQAPEQPRVPQPLKPGDPGGLTKEQLAAGVTPWDRKKGDAAPAAGEPYVVLKGGESIYAIARKMLGSEARWKELYEANRGVVSDPDRVAAGTKLYPPSKSTTAKKFRGLTDGLD